MTGPTVNTVIGASDHLADTSCRPSTWGGQGPGRQFSQIVVHRSCWGIDHSEHALLAVGGDGTVMELGDVGGGY